MSIPLYAFYGLVLGHMDNVSFTFTITIMIKWGIK